MGTIQHRAVLFTGQADICPIANFHAQVCAAEPTKDDGNSLVTPLYRGTNCYASFAILPDGSKLGWERSNEVDTFRQWALKLAATLRIEGVHVQWGELGLSAETSG